MGIKATKQNAGTIRDIIAILKKNDYTVEEAYSILDYTKARIKYTSKVGLDMELSFEED